MPGPTPTDIELPRTISVDLTPLVIRALATSTDDDESARNRAA